MARAKTNTRKSKNVLEQDRYTAELSTGQLVIGVCILLMFGLACFLLGVIIGKFDPTLHPEMAEESLPVVEPRSTLSTDASTNTVARRQEPLGGPVTTPPPPEMRVPPRTTSQEIPSNSESKPTKSVEPVSSKPVEIVANEKPEAPAPESIDTKQGASSESTPKPATAVVAKESATPAPPPIATPVPRARFSVQIASFRTRQPAEAVKKELEAKSDYTAELVISSSGVWKRVMVGSFAEKDSADKVQADLKNRYQYEDCYVVPR